MPVEANLEGDGKQVYVTCDEGEFARALEFYRGELKCCEIADDVQVVVTRRRSESSDIAVSVKKDRMALLGCGIVAFLFLFVFVAGIVQIIGWFRN